MNIFSALRKRIWYQHKPNAFVSKLLAQAEQVSEGAQALKDYIANPIKQHAIQIKSIEEQADQVRRALVLQLNGTFITPIDREDLFSLSRAIDDILDYMYSTTREMYILKVEPDDRLKTMVNILHESAQELCEAIKALEQQPDIAGKHALRVLKLENRMDAVYAEALAEIFQKASEPNGIVTVLKMREIYQHMYRAMTSAEQAANLITDIIIKFY